MRSIESLFIQGLVLSLTTQLVWTMVEPEAAASQPQGIVGALYRSASMKTASNEKEGDLNSGLSRGQRCVRCGTGGYAGYGGYADRYYDDYYYNRDYYNRGNYYGREDPLYYGGGAGGGRDQYYGRDRNWYYQQDSRNAYDRNPYDRYNYNRYDDRYYGRSNPYENDPYYSSGNGNSYYNSYRGNGYDNLNPSYYESMRDRFQRDRSGGGYDQYYDRYNDRPAYRGYYDNRNFRPYDETYSRGTAGFDYSGRGYYFANQNGIDHRPPPPPPPFDPQSQSYRPNFYEQSQHKPQQPPSNSNPYYNNKPQSQHTTPGVPPEYYNGKPAHSPSSSSNSHTQTVSSNTIGVDNGSASASNNKNNNNSNNNELDNKDKVSTTYGGRPQSLGSSYLFERTDDETNPAAGTGLNPPADKKPESANMEMKKE